MVFVISNQIFEPVEHSGPLVEKAIALKAKAATKVWKRGRAFIANSKETDRNGEEAIRQEREELVTLKQAATLTWLCGVCDTEVFQNVLQCCCTPI